MRTDTVKARLQTDPVIVLIRPRDTSHYYGQFALSQGGEKAHTFS